MSLYEVVFGFKDLEGDKSYKTGDMIIDPEKKLEKSYYFLYKAGYIKKIYDFKIWG